VFFPTMSVRLRKKHRINACDPSSVRRNTGCLPPGFVGTGQRRLRSGKQGTPNFWGRRVLRS
jgi:hypothetical protein